MPVEPREVALTGAASALRQALGTGADSRALFPLAARPLLPEEPGFGEQRGWVVEEGGAGGVKTQHLSPVVSITYSKYKRASCCAKAGHVPADRSRPAATLPPMQHEASFRQQLSGGMLVHRKGFNRELQGRTRGLASCLPARRKFKSFSLTKGR